MPYITTDDLKFQALWMAGEPTDGTSDFDTQVLTYMQAVYNVLVTGGTFGVRDVATSAGLYEHLIDIAQTDWLWLRKFPPFAFNSTPACIGSASSVTLNQGTQAGVVTVTFGSPTLTFDIAPSWNIPGGTASVTGGRLKILTQASGVPNPPITVPRIVTHTVGALTATLDVAWPQETQTVSDWVIWQSEYPLPADFERFCEAWKVQGGWISNDQPLNVGSYEQVFDRFPLSDSTQGPPSAAARMGTGNLMMNRWDTFSYRIEGQYVFQPPDLAIGVSQIPLVPQRWRQVISFGAAMLVAQDKVDNRAEKFASQFREIISSMSDEYRKEQNSGSELSGRMLYRTNGRGGQSFFLRTRSGLPFWP